MHACDYCGHEWPSKRAAAACCDPEPGDDRWINRGRE